MEKWALLACIGALVAIQGYIVWRLNQIRAEFVGAHGKTLRSLVQEWNKVTQTINALVFTLPEAEKPVTGHLRASEDVIDHPAGMSPSKRALYERRRKTG